MICLFCVRLKVIWINSRVELFYIFRYKLHSPTLVTMWKARSNDMPWRCLRCCEYSSSSQKYVRLSCACASLALAVSFCRTLAHRRLRRSEQIIAADYTRRTNDQMIYFDLSLFYTVTHSRSQSNMAFRLLIYLSIYFILLILWCVFTNRSAHKITIHQRFVHIRPKQNEYIHAETSHENVFLFFDFHTNFAVFRRCRNVRISVFD